MDEFFWFLIWLTHLAHYFLSVNSLQKNIILNDEEVELSFYFQVKIISFLFFFCRGILLRVWLDIPLCATFCRYCSLSLSLSHTHTHTPHISRMLVWELFRVAFSNWNDVSWIRILMLEVLCRSLLHCELVMLENLFINRFFIKNKIEGIRRAYNTVCDSCHLCFVYV